MLHRCISIAVFLLASAAMAELELVPCKLEAQGGRIQERAQCGNLAVPLNPDEPNGATIDLFVAVVPALAESGTLDPLTVIAGGPGDASTRFFAMARNAFSAILQTRDVVLVDQRGTGKSAALECPNMDDESLDQQLSASVEDSVELTLECLHALEHDPRYFSTSVAVRDLEQVRLALGYERLNIYGISYGTRVAQHYLRQYPERTRSVILDGLAPAVISLGPDTTIESQTALDALFERCENDPGCSQAFPAFRAQFYAVLERLEQQPAAVTIAHPRTGESTDLTLTRLAVAGAVRLLIYSPRTATMLPVLFSEAFEGSYERLAAQVLAMTDSVADLAAGLNYAVICTEDVPYWGPVDMQAQAETYMGSLFVEVLERVCETWPTGLIDPGFKEPVASQAPVLILTGEFDPITPARYVPLATETLANSVEILGAGQGHGMLSIGCVPRLMADFIDTNDVEGLDKTCTERIKPFPLFTSPMGPSP